MGQFDNCIRCYEQQRLCTNHQIDSDNEIYKKGIIEGLNLAIELLIRINEEYKDEDLSRDNFLLHYHFNLKNLITQYQDKK